eukprot:543137_1
MRKSAIIKPLCCANYYDSFRGLHDLFHACCHGHPMPKFCANCKWRMLMLHDFGEPMLQKLNEWSDYREERQLHAFAGLATLFIEEIAHHSVIIKYHILKKRRLFELFVKIATISFELFNHVSSRFGDFEEPQIDQTLYQYNLMNQRALAMVIGEYDKMRPVRWIISLDDGDFFRQKMIKIVPRTAIEKIMMSKECFTNPYFMLFHEIMRVSAISTKNTKRLKKLIANMKLKCEKNTTKKQEYNLFLRHFEENRQKNMFLPVDDEWEQKHWEKMQANIPEFRGRTLPEVEVDENTKCMPTYNEEALNNTCCNNRRCKMNYFQCVYGYKNAFEYRKAKLRKGKMKKKHSWYVCRGCLGVAYCSRKCQKIDWKVFKHKTLCN